MCPSPGRTHSSAVSRWLASHSPCALGRGMAALETHLTSLSDFDTEVFTPADLAALSNDWRDCRHICSGGSHVPTAMRS